MPTDEMVQFNVRIPMSMRDFVSEMANDLGVRRPQEVVMLVLTALRKYRQRHPDCDVATMLARIGNG